MLSITTNRKAYFVQGKSTSPLEAAPTKVLQGSHLEKLFCRHSPALHPVDRLSMRVSRHLSDIAPNLRAKFSLWFFVAWVFCVDDAQHCLPLRIYKRHVACREQTLSVRQRT